MDVAVAMRTVVATSMVQSDDRGWMNPGMTENGEAACACRGPRS
jgi:hypothetical protein